MSKTEAGRHRAIRWEPIRKSGACRRFSKLSTGCHGATNCSSGRAPPVPQICDIINICGQELHDMLRGIVTPRDALKKAQARAEEVMKT